MGNISKYHPSITLILFFYSVGAAYNVGNTRQVLLLLDAFLSPPLIFTQYGPLPAGYKPSALIIVLDVSHAPPTASKLDY